MCWYHATFHLDLEFEHTLDENSSGDHRVKFGRDPAICLREEAICAKKFTDRQTDGQTTDAAPLH